MNLIIRLTKAEWKLIPHILGNVKMGDIDKALEKMEVNPIAFSNLISLLNSNVSLDKMVAEIKFFYHNVEVAR